MRLMDSVVVFYNDFRYNLGGNILFQYTSRMTWSAKIWKYLLVHKALHGVPR